MVIFHRFLYVYQRVPFFPLYPYMDVGWTPHEWNPTAGSSWNLMVSSPTFPVTNSTHFSWNQGATRCKQYIVSTCLNLPMDRATSHSISTIPKDGPFGGTYSVVISRGTRDRWWFPFELNQGLGGWQPHSNRETDNPDVFLLATYIAGYNMI